MKSTPFQPNADLAPMPFDTRICETARSLKDAGLPWRPHAGCFVWDPEGHIEAPSPFPNRIYFILNLNRFLAIFGSVRDMEEKLIWLPTWHQARLICRRLGTDEIGRAEISGYDGTSPPGDDLLSLYKLLLEKTALFSTLK